MQNSFLLVFFIIEGDYPRFRNVFFDPDQENIASQ